MLAGVVAEMEELIALQRMVPRLSSHSTKHKAGSGPWLSPLRGRGMEFSEVRHYQAGDDIRHMDWRVTARTGRAHVKLYQEEKEQPFIVLVDFSASMYFGTRVAFKSVIAAKLAALFAWTVVKQGDRIGAFLCSEVLHQEFTPKSRESAVLPLLASLSTYTKRRVVPTDLSSAYRFSEELDRLRRVTKPGSRLVIISDFYQIDADSWQRLLRLAKHNDLLLYHVCDPLELAAPEPGLYPIADGKASFLWDVENRSLREAYQIWCDTRLQNLKAECRRLNIRYLLVKPEDSLPGLIRQSGFWRYCG